MPKTLIDGDIICYRASFSTKDDPPQVAKNKVDELLGYILEETQVFYTPQDYEVFLTGKGNFRYDIAKSYPYKGNRKGVDKPKHLDTCKQHMVDNWDAVTSVDEEADDIISIRATELGPDTIIASVDKDFHQVPCVHYNPTKGVYKTVAPWEGTKFFYTQILTGDRVDNIIGVKGIGPVKAEKALADCSSEQELWDTCVEAYGGDIDRVLENARLLWLRRTVGEIWEPPK